MCSLRAQQRCQAEHNTCTHLRRARFNERSNMFKQLDNVLSGADLAHVHSVLNEVNFEDGAATAGAAARKVKHNLQASTGSTNLDALNRLVLEALLRHDALRLYAMPLRFLPPIFSRYEPGMQYGVHIDNAIMGRQPAVRTDVAVTLFLTPPEQYDGGELIIGVEPNAPRLKLMAGSAVAYPATALHRVAEVSRGRRTAAVTWLQSAVRDSQQRETIADLAVALRFMRESAPQALETELIARTRANLIRMWADV